jgi:hypothetical protein
LTATAGLRTAWPYGCWSLHNMPVNILYKSCVSHDLLQMTVQCHHDSMQQGLRSNQTRNLLPRCHWGHLKAVFDGCTLKTKGLIPLVFQVIPWLINEQRGTMSQECSGTHHTSALNQHSMRMHPTIVSILAMCKHYPLGMHYLTRQVVMCLEQLQNVAAQWYACSSRHCC